MACTLALCSLGRGEEAGATLEPANDGWEGTSEVLALARAKLGEARVLLRAHLAWDEVHAGDGILVLHPTRAMHYREVQAFLADGGRLALLDDYGAGDQVLRHFDIHRTRGPLHPRQALRANTNLPLATPSVQMVAGQEEGRHPIVAEVAVVATNHPVGLRTGEGVSLTSVLEIGAEDEPSTLLALIGVIGDAGRCGLARETAGAAAPGAPRPMERCGRLFAMGDPSALMNQMLRYPGNRKLAEGLIEYLVEDDAWGSRGGSLYLVTGDFRESGSYGGASPLRRSIDERLDSLDDWVQEARHGGLPDVAGFALTVLAVGALLVWVGTHAARRFRPVNPGFARPILLAEQPGVVARASLLAAPTTPPWLTLLEQGAAMEEVLRHRLGLPPTASWRDLLEAIDARGSLDTPARRALAELHATLTRAQNDIASRGKASISSATVADIHQRLELVSGALQGDRIHTP